MLLDHLHQLTAKLAPHTDQVPEHEAAVELLVLTAYADHQIVQDELDQFDELESAHGAWDAGAFRVGQYLPVAVAKVRRALEAGDGGSELLHDASGRIHTPAVRAETLDACRAMASAGGGSPEKTEFVQRLESLLG